MHFGILLLTGRQDVICVKCRFDEIDARAADPAAIRRDMRAFDVPIGRAHNVRKLRYPHDDMGAYMPEFDDEDFDGNEDPRA